jgi:hypothetical protein
LFKAQLVGVYTVGEMPEELRPFVNLESRRERRHLKLSDRFVALRIEGTQAYTTLFLDSFSSIKDLEARLKEQECELTPVSRDSLERVLQERK